MSTLQQITTFSKRIYLYNIILALFITILTFVVTIFSGKLEITDMAPITCLITSVYAELGVHTAFYIWKAKNENCQKYMQQEKEKMQESNQEILNGEE